MGDREDISKSPQKNTGSEFDKSSRPASWSEIGRKWNVTRQRVVAVHDRMVVKLQDLLLDDPFIREWLDENDFDIDKLDREKLRRSNARIGRSSHERFRDTRGVSGSDDES